jgi:hypothetical protein
MEIQKADLRREFTIALSLAKEQQEPLIETWREEMVQMVVEFTRRFYGSSTTAMIQKGLEATVRLLSVALLHSTRGERDPDRWLFTLKAGGVKGVCRIVTDLVKEYDALPPSASVVVIGRTEHTSTPQSRMQILRELVEKSPQVAYTNLLRHQQDRIAAQRAARLGRWLLDNTSPGKIARMRCEQLFGTVTATFEEACDFILPRVCLIPPEYLPNPSDPADNELELGFALPRPVFQRAKRTYNEFVENIPFGLADCLNYGGKNWFERMVSVKVEAKDILKKKPASTSKAKVRRSTG